MTKPWPPGPPCAARPAAPDGAGSRLRLDPGMPMPTVEPPADPKLAFRAGDTPEAQTALARLTARYGDSPIARADAIVALGGDGFMLETLHRSLDQAPRPAIPVFGLNRGTIGFLLNPYREERLVERIAAAQRVDLHPLRMVAVRTNGERIEALAINEVSLLRETRQTAKVQILVDDVVRMPELVCDGCLVATPAGSTAYNFSAYGPIIPLGANILALTAISAFRPRRWRGALLPHTAVIRFHVLEARKRAVSAVADSAEVRDVAMVEVREDPSVTLTLLFDPESNLEERILKEQFQP